jgi:hypothetical protein
MALTLCYECKKQISDLATMCPHCGAPSAADREEQEKRVQMKKLGFDYDRVPKCPICRGSRISKVSLVDRVCGAGFIGTAGKTQKCGDCGAMF